MNKGISLIESELTFIVDSDDYLPSDAIEIVLKYHKKYSDYPNLCGYSFLRCHEDGKVNTAYFAKDEEINTYVNVHINGSIGGDKAEVYFTKILKAYPFEVFDGEKFMPEDAVWVRMSGPYNMVHINQNIYICDYLLDGLTKSGRNMKVKSPRGMMCRSKGFLENDEVCIKVKIKMMLLYIIYMRFAGIESKKARKELSQNALWVLCFIPANLIYLWWKIKLG